MKRICSRFGGAIRPDNNGAVNFRFLSKQNDSDMCDLCNNRFGKHANTVIAEAYKLGGITVFVCGLKESLAMKIQTRNTNNQSQ